MIYEYMLMEADTPHEMEAYLNTYGKGGWKLHTINLVYNKGPDRVVVHTRYVATLERELPQI